ncbi:aminotransferase class I/II-fold pyridoxal phosphate-dependent enzyme [Listeria booriae]|uniref:Aminotransferase class I/II-fold pyridoxal phosphate-dependent enzyme n=1 Tax=Listeria booriae TaxID=1552123 RepID=A0A841XVK8_9LIST|nr:aminotransferase class I/II-fold pyridoxal phosphate-dependent enzyme [Listeria booriae]MBC1371329.1 aminotransferase class I/II-fold pyridoxal phosphate-dependent enzyme [Listeria booriae]MBC2676729.1 aminotransferase class I/II-fold pyridoxal phosphate-dependent enzyme [Listeria booriae]
MKKYLLSPPHMSGKEQRYINEAFESNWIAPSGPHLTRFERELAEYHDVEDCVATSSGTSAIHLALRLLDVKQGDTVFCSSFTFIASINPAIYLGATPVFIDSEPLTWGMCPDSLELALKEAKHQNRLPKAIIVVHLYGQSAQIEALLEIATAYGVPIVEDAAESLGAEYNGKKLGTFGEFGIFSFNGNKIITTSGGGALIGKSAVAIEHARFLSSQAKEDKPYYHHKEVGYNYRLSNVLAGIGIAQFAVLDKRIRKKRAIFNLYQHNFQKEEGITFMPEQSFSFGNRWLTTCTTNKSIQDKHLYQLVKQGIEVRRLWKPLHTQPVFKDCSFYKLEKKAVSESLYEHGLCLPSGTMLTITDIDWISGQLRKELLN